MTRHWCLHYHGHTPVILNGWPLSKVAAYERRHAFDGKVLALNRKGAAK